MLAFIDESGHPHPNDPNKRPVVVAVCFSERDSRLISGRIHALKRDLLNSERIELKGVKLLNRRTHRVKRDYWGFLEEFYGNLLNLPITVFAIIMEAPFGSGEKEDEFLPGRFRYLIQRISLLAESRDEMATVIFTGDSAGNSIASCVGTTRAGLIHTLLMRPCLRRFRNFGRHTGGRYDCIGDPTVRRGGAIPQCPGTGRPLSLGD